jgi:hypothetical protein
MTRVVTLLAALLFAFPAAAFAQGAGDDQYQDPFGDEPSQNDSGGGSDAAADGELSDEPPVSGGGSSGGESGSSGSGSPGSGTSPSIETPAASAQASSELPRTGAEPLHILGLGAAFLLMGVGLRLRTIDPDAY